MSEPRVFMSEYQHTKLSPYPLQVPLVKSVYVLVHKGAQDAVRLLADQVQTFLDKKTLDGLAAAVKAIRAFWDSEIPNSTPAGRTWRALLDKAAAVPLSDSASSYKAKLEELLQGLGCFLRAAE